MPASRQWYGLVCLLLIPFGTAACGSERGSIPSTGEAADSLVPWIQIDPVGQRLTLQIEAGQTQENSYWNINGFYDGAGRIVVPLGWDVVIEFQNSDPAMAHSLGLEPRREAFPSDFAPIEPAFPGAASPHAGQESLATKPGGVETLRFRADSVGEYSLVCYIPGHAAVGQFLPLDVVKAGTPGFIP